MVQRQGKKRCFLHRAAPLAMLAAVLLTAGCATRGYYQEQAVEKARKFLLKECPGMPFYDQEYIKFNRPVLLIAPITQGYATGLSQICVTWLVPGNPESYMVFGTSDSRMLSWDPVRVLRKNFERPQQPYLTAATVVRNYLLQNQFSLLDPESLNHVRYTLPGLWYCTFPLDFNPEIPWTQEELEKVADRPRYVLGWKITENGREYYVFGGGLAADETLMGFQLYFSGMLPAEEFRTNLTDPEPVIAPFGGEAGAEKVFTETSGNK